MGANKPELQGHWRHVKLRTKLDERRAEQEALAIKAAARAVIVNRKAAFVAEQQRKAQAKAKWRQKNDVQKQQMHLSRIMGASVKQFETQSMLHDMKTTLRNSTNAVSEHVRTVDRLTDSLTRLQDHNRREPKYYDAESKIKDMLQKIRKPVLTSEGVLPRHMDVLRAREQIGAGNDTAPGKQKLPKIKFIEIDAVGKKEPLYNRLKSCPICSKDIMPSLFTFHKVKCQSVKTQRILTVVDCEVPQVPREVVVSSAPTSREFSLTWEPPIFDGGTPITEYEIRMSICTREIIGKRTKRHISVAPTKTVTRYTYPRPYGPVPTTHRLRELPAGTEYVDIVVCAVNDVGASLPSNIVLATMLPATSPSQPLFFRCQPPTANTCSLNWFAPLDTGGSPIVGYKIEFKTSMSDEVSGAGTGSTETHDVERIIEVLTNSNDLGYLLQELLSDQPYTEIAVRAINAAGLTGARSNVIPEIICQHAGFNIRYREELNRAIKTTALWIDSDVMQKGLRGYEQRFRTHIFINLMVQELQKLDDHEWVEAKMIEYQRIKTARFLAEERAKARKAAGYEALEDTASNEVGGVKMTQWGNQHSGVEAMSEEDSIRTYQFEHKIRDLQNSISFCEESCGRAARRRSELTSAMRKTEFRLMEFRSELDRAVAYPGRDMDSRVVHGSFLQRYRTAGLIVVLRECVDEALEDLSAMKQESIQIERATNMLKQKQEKSEGYLRIREAAFFKFQKEMEKKRKLKLAAAGGQSGQGSKALIALARKGVVDYFATWVRYWKYRLESKVTCEKFFVQFFNRTLNAGFQQWKQVVQDMINFEHVGGSGDSSAGSGVGSMLLAKVDALRKNNLLDASAMLLELKNIREEMKKMETTPLAQRTLQQSSEYIAEKERKHALEAMEEEERETAAAATAADSGSKSRGGPATNNKEDKEVSLKDLALSADEKADLTAGDCYCRFRDWGKAISCYETYLARAMAAKKPREQAVAYGKLGHAHFENKSFDQAILQYRSQKLLVSELDGERSLLAGSFMGLGKCYFEMANYKLCSRHYISALMTYQVLCNVEMEISACRGLENTYIKTGDVDKQKLYRTRAETLEAEVHTTKRVSSGMSRLQTLRTKLEGTGPMPTEIVNIERVPARVPRLRNAIEQLEEDIEDMIMEAKMKEQALSIKQRKRDMVKAELKTAGRMEVAEATTTLITGGSQTFDVPTLKKRLAKALKEFEKDADDSSKALNSLVVRTSNARDDISEYQEQLNTEKGQLMAKAAGNRKLRCVGLNKSNTKTNDVMGENSGGVPYFVGSYDNNFVVFGLLFGDCVKVCDQDPLKHTKTILSVCYYNNTAYSGGMDNAVVLWDLCPTSSTFLTATRRLEHQGSVWAVEADDSKLVTACANCSFNIYGVADDYALMKTIDKAHKKTIRCFCISPDLICTGAADYCIKVWDVESTFQEPFKYVKLHRRLRGGRHGGHTTVITEIQFAASELVSGDKAGLIIVWDIPTAVILRKCQAFEKSVRSIQFDATRIFATSDDRTCVVIDITTGDIMERFYNHTSAVLALAMDGKEVLTISAERMLHCYFDRNTDKKTRRYHLLCPGESLGTLKRRYGVTISKLKEWNNIKDVAMDVYLGMRLMVALSSSGGIAFRQELFTKKKEEYKARVRKERLHRLKMAFKLENDLLEVSAGNSVSNIRDKVAKEASEKQAKASKEAEKTKARDERNAALKAQGLEPDAFSDEDESDGEEVDPFADNGDDSDSSSSSSDDDNDDNDDAAPSEAPSSQPTARSEISRQSSASGSSSGSSGSDSD
jgi:WD40 repeat protein